MHRNYLLEMLSSYALHFPEEEILKQEMISFIKKNEHCFERSLEAGHITASSWILNYDRSKALLMHHKKLDKWLQLGGHCDGDHNTLKVALKEAQEESGIADIMPIRNNIFDIDIHFIPANAQEKGHYHYDIRYLLQITKDQLAPGNDESNALRWITKDVMELPTSDPSMLRMFNKWLKEQ